jgi:hypothetical protein
MKDEHNVRTEHFYSDRLESDQHAVRGDLDSYGPEGQKDPAEEASKVVANEVQKLTDSPIGARRDTRDDSSCDQEGRPFERDDAATDPLLPLISDGDEFEEPGDTCNSEERLSPNAGQVCSSGKVNGSSSLCAGNGRKLHKRSGRNTEQEQTIANLKTQLESAVHEIERLEHQIEDYRETVLLIISHTDPHPNTNRRVLLEIQSFLEEHGISATIALR